MKNKRVLVAGGAGSIGSELVRQLSTNNKVFVLDINESGLFNIQQETKASGRVGDIRDQGTVHDIFSDFKPQIVINAAAYKHVPLLQLYPIEAINTNIVGNYNLINEAKKWECLEKYVFISSDKAVSANSVMGASKRFSEVLTQNLGGVVVRFGNVLGSRGSLIPIWEEQINKGVPITVTDERMERYFMTIKEACSLVIEAAERGKGGEIFILNMGKPIKILDLATQLVKHLSLNTPIETIGIRDGETLTERLMTAEEELTAAKEDKFFIIR